MLDRPNSDSSAPPRDPLFPSTMWAKPHGEQGCGLGCRRLPLLFYPATAGPPGGGHGSGFLRHLLSGEMRRVAGECAIFARSVPNWLANRHERAIIKARRRGSRVFGGFGATDLAMNRPASTVVGRAFDHAVAHFEIAKGQWVSLGADSSVGSPNWEEARRERRQAGAHARRPPSVETEAPWLVRRQPAETSPIFGAEDS